MDRSELEIIKELMAELEDKMQPSEEDFSERLGREKPEVKVLKIEGDMESPELEKKEEMMGQDLEGDQEMGEDHMSDEMDPEAKLKARLLKLRS